MVVLSDLDIADIDDVTGDALDRCLVLVDYDESVARLVAALKFRRVRTAVPWIAEAMAARLTHAGERPDVVTWVPASGDGRRRRGFDQGEVIAGAVARELGLRATGLLGRSDRRHQTGRPRTDRLEGPQLALRGPTWGPGLAGASVVVIDDVVTTGGSLAAAARALRVAAPARVIGMAVAHRCLVP